MTTRAIASLLATALIGCAAPKAGTDSSPVADPRPVAPMSGTLVFGRRPEVRWSTSVPNTRVQFCADRRCTRLLGEIVSTSNHSPPTVDLPDGIVFWRVASANPPPADGAWTPTWWFLVDHGATDDAARARATLTLSGEFDVDGDGVWDAIDSHGHIRIAPMTTGDGVSRGYLARLGQYAPMNAGDLNGDGYLDVVTADTRTNGNRGTVYVYLGPLDATVGAIHPLLAINAVEDEGARCGAFVAAGDFNGDGYADLSVGCDGAARGRGRVLMYDGGPSGPSMQSSRAIDSPNGFNGRVTPQAAADLDGDGFADLVAGSFNGNHGWAGWFAGSQDGVGLSPSWGESLYCPELGWSGLSSAVGDLDGDGVPEIVAASTGGTNQGCVRVLATPDASATWSERTRACGSPSDPIVPGLNVGDFDGDARTDAVAIVLGAAPDLTRLALFSGSSSSVTPWPRADVALTFAGPVPHVTVADVDGDGFTDVLVESMVADTLTATRVYRGTSAGLALQTRAFGP